MHSFRFILLLNLCLTVADALRVNPESSNTLKAPASGGLADTFAGAAMLHSIEKREMRFFNFTRKFEPPPVTDVQFFKFHKEFQERVRTAPKKNEKFLNTALLETGKISQDGVWLKFGVDMSCDRGRCNKIGPLADHRRENGGIFGFDWFQGLPERWRDNFESGMFGRGGKIPKPPSGVEWVIGLYNETLPMFFQRHVAKVSYLLIDCDLYSSAKYVLDVTWPHLTKDAIIYFDEIMNYRGYELGEFRALYEFLDKNQLDYEVVMAAADLKEIEKGSGNEFDQQIALRFFEANQESGRH